MYLVIATYSDDDGLCWPSVETIAAGAGMNAANVRRHLVALVAAGLIGILPGGGRGHTNLYRLHVEVVPNPRGSSRQTRADPRDEVVTERVKNAPICPGCGDPCHEPGRVVHIVCDPATPSRPVGPTVRYIGTSPADVARRARWRP